MVTAVSNKSHFNKHKVLKFKELRKLDMDMIPDPLTWHVIVQPYEPEDTTTKGFFISEQDSDDYKKVHCVGKIIKMGELCFKTEAFKNSKPYEVGDVVFFARHSGMWMNWNGEDLCLLADDRMLLKIKEEQLLNFDGFQNHYEEFKD